MVIRQTVWHHAYCTVPNLQSRISYLIDVANKSA